jgi:hypothetical protein
MVCEAIYKNLNYHITKHYPTILKDLGFIIVLYNLYYQ